MALAVAALNGVAEANLGVWGPYRARAVTITFASVSYATGGVDLSGLFTDDFGITFPRQMFFSRVQADNTAGLEGVGAKWDATNQKLLLYGSGVASDPAEVPNTTSLTSLEIDALILGKS